MIPIASGSGLPPPNSSRLELGPGPPSIRIGTQPRSKLKAKANSVTKRKKNFVEKSTTAPLPKDTEGISVGSSGKNGKKSQKKGKGEEGARDQDGVVNALKDHERGGFGTRRGSRGRKAEPLGMKEGSKSDTIPESSKTKTKTRKTVRMDLSASELNSRSASSSPGSFSSSSFQALVDNDSSENSDDDEEEEEEDQEKDEDYGEHDDGRDGDDDDDDASGEERRPPRFTKESLGRHIHEDQWDWTDTTSLPIPGAARRLKEIKLLDESIHNSALFDVAEEQFDLARTLFQWRLLETKQQEAELRSAHSKKDEEMGVAKEDVEPDSNEDDDQEQEQATSTKQQTTSRIPTTVPMPSALTLEKMTRWPILPSLLEEGQIKAITLDEALEEVLSKNLKGSALLDAVRIPSMPPLEAALDAYGANAPFGIYATQLSSSTHQDQPNLSASTNPMPTDEDEAQAADADALDSSLDDPLEDLDRHPLLDSALGSLKTTVQGMMEGLLERVERGPPPPMDFYQKTKTIYPIDKPRAIGWETVLEVAKSLEGVSENVTNELERRLIEIYGPSTRPTHPIDSKPYIIPPPPPARRKDRNSSTRATSRAQSIQSLNGGQDDNDHHDAPVTQNTKNKRKRSGLMRDEDESPVQRGKKKSKRIVQLNRSNSSSKIKRANSRLRNSDSEAEDEENQVPQEEEEEEGAQSLQTRRRLPLRLSRSMLSGTSSPVDNLTRMTAKTTMS